MQKQSNNNDYYRNRSIKRLKILGIIAAVIAVIICIFMFMYQVKEVVVDGNEHYSDQEIMGAVGADSAFNTFIYYQSHKNVTQIPDFKYVDHISIDMKDKNTIVIDVVEKVIVGCINDNGMFMYFDSTGTVLESSTTRDEKIPIITGGDFRNLEVGKSISETGERDYDNLLELTLLLTKYDIAIDQIIFYDNGNMTLQMGNILVALGNGAHLEERVSCLNDVLTKLEGLEGTLDLENYNMAEDSIIFHKKVQNVVE